MLWGDDHIVLLCLSCQLKYYGSNFGWGGIFVDLLERQEINYSKRAPD